MTKGDTKKAAILDTALEAARRDGLEALTIGSLAKSAEMSKSGLFAHFESKANLQCEVLEHAAAVFVKEIVVPALNQPRGEPRLRALFENWLDWALAADDDAGGGCIFLAAAMELDDAEGPVRDFLVRTQRDWQETLRRSIRIAKEESHMRADVDVDQLAYRIHANMMGFHYYARLLRDPNAEKRARDTFESLLADGQ